MTRPYQNWAVERAYTDPRFDHLWEGLQLAYPMEGQGKLLINRGPANIRYNATITDDTIPGVWQGGENGVAVQLDGSAGYITTTRFAGLSNWSIGLWYRPSSVSGRHPIIDQGDILIYQQDDDIIWGITDSVFVDRTSTAASVLTADTWTHILVTKKGNSFTLFINGRSTDTLTDSNTALASLANLVFGSNSRTSFVFPALPTLTTENGIVINASDDMRYTIGSETLNSSTITENWNSAQMTIRIRCSLSFVPGDGLTHVILENRGTGSSQNRIDIRMTVGGIIWFTVFDKDSTRHRVTFNATGWAAGEEHQIVCVIDFKNDAIALYTDGTLRDNMPDNTLSSDSIDAVESTTQIGADTDQANQLNGSMTIQAFSRAWTATEVDDDDPGIAFVVDQDTVFMGDFTESGTGIIYWPGQLKINSISTVTLTMNEAADTQLVAGDEVVVYDDDNPPNIVYTGVASVSGTTVVVDDSCAAVSGTNKTITRNLFPDGDQESTNTALVTADVSFTVTKDTSTIIRDSRSLKLVAAAANDGDNAAFDAHTLASGQEYRMSWWTKPEAIDDSSVFNMFINGLATPIVSRECAKALDDRGNFARAFDLDGSIDAEAANNTIHDFTTEDLGIWAWVKLNTDASGFTMVVEKQIVSGYWFGCNDGVLEFNIDDGPDSYALSGNTDIRDGQWHFAAGIIDKSDASNCKLYLDGIEDGTTNKLGTVTDVGLLTNARILRFGSFNGSLNWDGKIAEWGIAYPSDIMAANEMGAAGEIANLFNNPGDPSQWPNSEDYWLCNDNAGNTTVTGANNNLTASANTEDFATYNDLYWEQSFTADQAAITVAFEVTGAGAGANSATVYVDEVDLQSNMVANGSMEGGADPPASWTQEASATVVSDTTPHTGTNCLKVTAGAANVGASQNITLVSGQYYTVSVWADATSGDTATVVMDTGDTTEITVGTVTATDWTKVQATFKATGTAGVLYLRGTANGDVVRYDDALVTRDDTRAANTADRTRDFANARFDTPVLWDKALSPAQTMEMREDHHAMFQRRPTRFELIEETFQRIRAHALDDRYRAHALDDRYRAHAGDPGA